MKVGITTTHARVPYPYLDEFIQDAQMPFFTRGSNSLEKIMQEEKLDGLIVWKACGPEFYLKEHLEQPFFYHPSMAKNRINAWRKKQQPDALARAAGLCEGDSFLDCTLGMGADALTASYITGEKGKVTGIESSDIIALVIRWGLRMYAQDTSYTWMKPALSRIEVVHSDSLEYLKQLPDHSYDVIYFDPMFRKPVYASQAISVIRSLANSAPLEPETVREACRAARRCVVLKEKRESGEFERLGFQVVQESRTSKIAYGKIEVAL